MITLAHFKLDEILPHIGLGMPKLQLETSRGTFKVKAASPRLECLKRNQSCVRCHLKGDVWFLEMSVQKAPKVATNCFIHNCPWCALKRKTMPVGRETPHLNLYAFRRGRKILMTQDHIFPKHAGGSNGIENLQTMCTQCNSYKGGLLPHEYSQVMTSHERAAHLRGVDGGSPHIGGLSSVHTPVFDQAHTSDCAAE